MNNEPVTREMVKALLQRAFDLMYQDDKGDGEVDAADVVDAIENAYSTTAVIEMLEITGAESVMGMVLMYLDGRTQTKI